MARKKMAEDAVLERPGVSVRSEDVRFDWLVPQGYNPREIDDAELRALKASICEFGIVDPFVARDNGELLGGHQRHRAISELLADAAAGKPYKFTNSAGEPDQVSLSLPDGTVPCRVVSGLTDASAKILNIALNKIGGRFNDDELAKLLYSMREEGVSEDALALTGMAPAELTDYLDLGEQLAGLEEADTATPGEGTVPAPSNRSPKLDLEFSRPDLRDAVKAEIAAKTRPGELGGDALARALGVRVRPKKKRA